MRSHRTVHRRGLLASATSLPAVACLLAATVISAGARQSVISSRPADVVLYASDLSQSTMHGFWTLASDAASPGGIKLANFDFGQQPPAQPNADPDDYLDLRFLADAATPYHVWLRLKGVDPAARGDAVWAQFSDALVDGRRAYEIGTTHGLLVSLDRCGTCDGHGWGWHDTSSRLGQPAIVTFQTAGVHTLRVQGGGTGVQIDQVVLSADRYLRVPPGPDRNDSTVVERFGRGW